MKNKNTFLFLFAIALLFVACKKDKGNCPDDGGFCVFVENQDFKSTGSFINNFLSSQEGSDEKQLNQLQNWFNCKSCVSETEIICNSCIRTNPPQSELRIYFKSNTIDTTLIIDILMDQLLRFSRYHE